ncbi:hypothetical protein SASPL_133617 [Salvia splendens]|uniref:Disease resistance protein RPM1 n=1 Tax=Salvia splendens TaxID=180675 RepID=A0A8X8X5Y3_SALSN|nr:hypothetical protein SASPL_133617 [Salvia splendens]
MEARIKDATHLAEDTIEFLLSDALLKYSTARSKLKHQLRGRWEQIQSRYASIKSKVGSSSSKSEQANDYDQIRRRHDLVELKKVGKEIESVSEQLMVIKNSIIPVEDGLLGGGSSLAPELEAQRDSMKQHHVFQKLKCRRFLIVLDDVWSRGAWDELRLMFPDDRNGSRIILTTRLLDVATYVDNCSHIHFMHLMDEDQSWDLLKHKVFFNQASCPDKLAFEGKMIARSCRGLPLAIVVISGLLVLDQTKSGWKTIATNVNSVISENDEQILDLINAYECFHKNDNSYLYSLPEELFELFHLRYLAFDYAFKIPAVISNLQNLQTLIIGPRKYKGNFVEIWRMPQQLPAEIWGMPQLRHLVFCSGLRLFQKGATSALQNLQTLSLAINFSCRPEILQMIPNLKKLSLYYTRGEYLHAEIRNEEQSRVYSVTFVEQLKNIGCLRLLENLKLKLHHSLPYPGELTLRALPLTLKKLTLSGLKLPWRHMKIVDSLPNLQVLKLREFACNGAEWETSEGGFCELRFLLISQSNLKVWVTESSHFPRLNCLVLLRCPNLSEIPQEIGEIATLQLIEMDNWNKHLVESAKQIQDEQESCGNDPVRLRFI